MKLRKINKRLLGLACGAVILLLGTLSWSWAQTTDGPEKAGSVTNLQNSGTRQAIQETGQAAVQKIQTAWDRIDEQRLKNRSRDEIVAWVIMGCLAGGLLFRFGKRGQLTSIILGLVGAFIGGMVAHVTQLSLGLGPVLITYEDLLCTLAGAVIIIVGVRWSLVSKLFKPAGK